MRFSCAAMAYLGSVASEPIEYSVGRGSGSLESREFQIAYLGDSRIANSESRRIPGIPRIANSESGGILRIANSESCGIADWNLADCGRW